MAIEQHPPKRSKPNLPEHMPDLLPEIITEILSRLPVKSLLQFRSVSKSWRSMISDPKFVKTHLNHCFKDEENAHHKLIVISYRHGNKAVENCHLSPVLNGFSVNPMELDYPLKKQPHWSVNPMELDYPRKHPNSSFWIVGSINGLICIIIDEQHTFLWNPSTRISKKLPDLGIKLRGLYLVGFGYDESTDDYKVVVIFFHKYLITTKVMVYSSRTGFWRKIGDFPLAIRFDESGKFVNGAIHWAAGKKTGSDLVLIVSLDMENETYGEVAQPSYGEVDGEGEFEMSLGVLGECLCVLYYFHGNRTDVWMMKEYGVRESWTKLTTIPYVIDILKSE